MAMFPVEFRRPDVGTVPHRRPIVNFLSLLPQADLPVLNAQYQKISDYLVSSIYPRLSFPIFFEVVGYLLY
jgi:hypothetical protein